MMASSPSSSSSSSVASASTGSEGGRGESTRKKRKNYKPMKVNVNQINTNKFKNITHSDDDRESEEEERPWKANPFQFVDVDLVKEAIGVEWKGGKYRLTDSNGKHEFPRMKDVQKYCNQNSYHDFLSDVSDDVKKEFVRWTNYAFVPGHYGTWIDQDIPLLSYGQAIDLLLKLGYTRHGDDDDSWKPPIQLLRAGVLESRYESLKDLCVALRSLEDIECVKRRRTYRSVLDDNEIMALRLWIAEGRFGGDDDDEETEDSSDPDGSIDVSFAGEEQEGEKEVEMGSKPPAHRPEISLDTNDEIHDINMIRQQDSSDVDHEVGSAIKKFTEDGKEIPPPHTPPNFQTADKMSVDDPKPILSVVRADKLASPAITITPKSSDEEMEKEPSIQHIEDRPLSHAAPTKPESRNQSGMLLNFEAETSVSTKKRKNYLNDEGEEPSSRNVRRRVDDEQHQQQEHEQETSRSEDSSSWNCVVM